MDTRSSALRKTETPDIKPVAAVRPFYDKKELNAELGPNPTIAEAVRAFDRHLTGWDAKRSNPAQREAVRIVHAKGWTSHKIILAFDMKRDRLRVLYQRVGLQTPKRKMKVVTEFNEVALDQALPADANMDRIRRLLNEHIPGWNRHLSMNNPSPLMALRFLYTRQYTDACITEIFQRSPDSMRYLYKKCGLAPYSTLKAKSRLSSHG
jgi:hypothetical protein